MEAKRLGKYFVRKALHDLPLSETFKKHALALLDSMENDQRINVARIHEQLFPSSTTASANSSLNRLLAAINMAAERKGAAFAAKITQDKKAGAANRYIWFEGPPPDPELPYLAELRSIPAGSLVSDQKGYFPSENPVIVLITINEHETRAVLREFHPKGEPQRHPITGVVASRLGVHGGMEIIHCVGRQGEDETQRLCHTIIQGLRPRAVIGVGIAFGVNPDKQNIGDVLLPEAVLGYDLARISPASIDPRGPRPPVSDYLFRVFKHTDQTCKAAPDSCLRWPTIHIGTVLSGNKLVDNLDFRKSLENLAPEIIGGEMEAIGIQTAADSYKVDWIIIKAICDWADGNKNTSGKEQDQRQAAQNAALVVHHALKMGNLYPDSGRAMGAGTEGAATVRDGKEKDFPSMRRQDLEKIAERQRYDIYAYPLSMHKDAEAAGRQAGNGADVLTTLLEWAHQSETPHFFALLGEYGMGKTVTCQRLDEELRRRRREDGSLPLPIYFDLRNITGLDRRVPTLADTIVECFERGGVNRGVSNEYTLDTVYDLMEKQATVIIFDGLDEVLVKLRENDGQIFTRDLLRLFVDAKSRRAGQTLNVPLPKILISCRSQFFRTLRDQKNHFTGQERGEHRAEAFAAMVLLPLNEEQVTRYLRGAFPETDPQRLLDTIRAVHDLEELSRRPYTLKLVADFLPEIEEDRTRGVPIYGVSLYRRIAERWLERDAGKHHIRAEHKMCLAAHLAAHLWQHGSGLLPAGEIENWFHAWLESVPSLRRRYVNLHPDQLEEDLRTATFLARQDDGAKSAFRFAHTSLLEFFLADYLFQAVRDDLPERWRLNRAQR